MDETNGISVVMALWSDQHTIETLFARLPAHIATNIRKDHEQHPDQLSGMHHDEETKQAVFIDGFSPEYDVPREITTRPEIYDKSSCDDLCPAFGLRSYRYADQAWQHPTLTVDHPVASSRMIPTNPRFVVYCDDGDDNLAIVFSSETDCFGAIAALLALEG